MEREGEGSFHVTPMQRVLFVDGRDAEDQPCSGLVLAFGWWSASPRMHYLISDIDRPAPVWVAEDRLSMQRWYSAGESHGAEADTRGAGPEADLGTAS